MARERVILPRRPKPPEKPTDAMPGSEEKLLVLIERVERGEALWHPKDRRFWFEKPLEQRRLF